MQVGITTGNIIEENHYYTYGLKIATISSKKLGDTYEGQLKSNYLYQGAYSELDDDIGWHDFFLRNYDAQIGRFVQQDPFQQFPSPYTGMGNDPINLTDPSGGETLPFRVIKIGGEMSQTAATAITLGEVVVRSVSTAARAANGLSTLMKVANITVRVFQVANVLNNAFNTIKVGEDPVMDHLNNLTKLFDKKLKDELALSQKANKERAFDITYNKTSNSYSAKNERQSPDANSVTPCRCADTKNGEELAGEAHNHPSYPKSYPTDPNVDSPPSGDDIAAIWKGLHTSTKPLYYTSIIETESVRYAIVVTDVGVAKKYFTASKEKANIRAFENEFYNTEKGTGVWTQDFKRTVSELYKDSGVKIFKTTNPDKTTWLEIKRK